MQNPQIQPQVVSHQLTEEILVVSRAALFQTIWPWYGIQPSVFEKFTNIIQEHATFMPRAHAETNSNYKQIIPYMLFVHDHKLFVMQRKSTASEQRLANQFSLGIGGHIRQEDLNDNNVISWAMREFKEEVTYHATLQTQQIGVLNDDSSDVGKVHLGLILLLKGSSDQIQIKDEHKSGTLLTLTECKALYDNMENWSKICLDFLLEHPELLQ